MGSVGSAASVLLYVCSHFFERQLSTAKFAGWIHILNLLQLALQAALKQSTAYVDSFFFMLGMVKHCIEPSGVQSFWEAKWAKAMNANGVPPE